MAIAGLLGVTVLGALPNGAGSSAVATAPGYVDPRAMLDARSPGARPHGALFQTKPGLPRSRVAPTAANPPAQRVLSSVRDRPMFIPVDGTPPLATIPPLNPIPVAAAGLPGSGFGPSIDPLIPSFFSVPPTRPTTPIGPTGPIVTPPSAVPEPDAWLMLIAGHAVLGWSLRRRRRPTLAR